MILVVAAVTADWTAINLGDGPQTAGGGAVGAWLSASLAESFSSAWQVVLVTGTFVVGAFLATEYFVVPTLRGVRWGLRGLLSILRWGKAAFAVKPARCPARDSPKTAHRCQGRD